MSKFSYFSKPISNTKPSKSITLPELYELIKGERFAEATLQLRQITDAKEARAFKAKNFDYVTFSGVFTSRADQALQQHSGLMCLDFDHVPDTGRLKDALLKLSGVQTRMLFVSPSGDGLKWIITAELEEMSHLEFFRAVEVYVWHSLGLSVDPSGKDVSRACFLAHDPEALFLNPPLMNTDKN